MLAAGAQFQKSLAELQAKLDALKKR
jgi:hypothetical protein